LGRTRAARAASIGRQYSVLTLACPLPRLAILNFCRIVGVQFLATPSAAAEDAYYAPTITESLAGVRRFPVCPRKRDILGLVHKPTRGHRANATDSIKISAHSVSLSRRLRGWCSNLDLQVAQTLRISNSQCRQSKRSNKFRVES
jgi:hypothetical protein